MLPICCFVTAFTHAQPIDYTVKVTQVEWRSEFLDDCWETGSEEYTALVWFNDKTDSTNVGGECFTCSGNDDCTITPNTIIGSKNNSCAETIRIIFQGFENDNEPRCIANGGDDCRCGPEVAEAFEFRSEGPGCREYGPFGCTSSHNAFVEICWDYSPPVTNTCETGVTAYEGPTSFILSEQCNGTDNSSCAYNDYNAVWYKYTANNDLQSLRVSVLGNFDTALSIFDACGGNEIACDDDSGAGSNSQIILDCVLPETTYYAN